MKALRKTVFAGIFPHQKRMVQAVGLLGFYQKSGLQTVARKIGFMNLFPESLQQMERALPAVPKHRKMKSRSQQAVASESAIGKGGFFLWLFNGYDVS